MWFIGGFVATAAAKRPALAPAADAAVGFETENDVDTPEQYSELPICPAQPKIPMARGFPYGGPTRQHQQVRYRVNFAGHVHVDCPSPR